MDALKIFAVSLGLWLLVGWAAGCGGGTSDSSGGGGALGLIAYESTMTTTSDIMLMNGDGSDPRLVVAHGNHPCLCRNGTALTFMRGLNVFTVNADGTGQFNVTQIPPGTTGIGLSNPAFNLNASEIAYVQTVIVPGATPSIHTIDADGSNDSLLIDDGDDPEFSADGNRIVFMRGSDICLVNRDGTGFVNLTGGAVGVSRSHPSLNPIGTLIVYASAPVVPGAVDAIWILDVATGATSQVLANGTQPSFSADGLGIVFVRDGRIHRTDLAGTTVVPLTAGPGDALPSWE